jgi:ketosteroid isomerase-like protein
MPAIHFINSFYQAIIDKKLTKIHESYLASDETYVILEGPRLATKGFEKIASGWVDFCKSSIQLSSIEWLEGPFIFDFSDTTTLAGVVRLIGKISPEKTFDNTFRASFLLAKIDGQYKIVHEHVSGALTDPYGIGDWKK